MPRISLYNGDCLEAMKEMEDNTYDLAIVDPPYGNDGIKGGYTANKGGGIAKNKIYHTSLWELDAPNAMYFNELFRVSKNQIIWGANYYPQHMPSTMGWGFWDKKNGDVSFSDGEIYATTFNSKARVFSYRWSGMLQENMKNKEHRIHPTQKPVQLYKWLLKNYAKEGDKILDTHGGSMSSAIACHDMGFDLDLWELDKEYYEAGVKRYNNHIKQLTLF
jgi:site-specific DNA-methyltransferase (adenine-specific)